MDITFSFYTKVHTFFEFLSYFYTFFFANPCHKLLNKLYFNYLATKPAVYEFFSHKFKIQPHTTSFIKFLLNF